MKNIILLILVLTSLNLCYSQDFTRITIDNSFGFTRGIEVSDLNNDGHIDVIGITVDSSPEIAFWLGDGTGNFGGKIIVDNNLDDLGGNGDDITVLDVNNDGYLDIIASVQISFDNKIVWYPNNQNGTFGAANIIDSGGRDSNDIVIFDVDNNGFDDIVIDYRNIPSNVYSLYYYPNLGNGTFNTKVLISSVGVNGLESALLNNDLFPDLIYTAGSVNVLLNNSDGTFGSVSTIDNNYPGNFISTGRINNDAFEDIVVSGIGSQETMVWYAGDGSGNFGTSNTISSMVYTQITHSKVGDLDSDGDMDIVATAFSSSDLIWWQNDGNGNFSSAQIINSETSGNYDLKISDINEDGKLDIVMSNTTGIYWFQNNLTLSIDDIHLNNENVILFPNPSSGKFYFNSDVFISKIKVFDVIGKLIFSSTILNNEIDLTTNLNGFYFVKFETEKGVISKKFIKQ